MMFPLCFQQRQARLIPDSRIVLQIGPYLPGLLLRAVFLRIAEGVVEVQSSQRTA